MTSTLEDIARWQFKKGASKSFTVRHNHMTITLTAVQGSAYTPIADVNKSDYDVLRIMVPGKKTGTTIPCMYMNVQRPKKPSSDLITTAWISTILYNDKKPIEPSACKLEGPDGTRWGAVIIDVCIDVAMAFGAEYIALIDSSFVTKCGKHISLTDYLHRRGAQGFYERRGFLVVRGDMQFPAIKRGVEKMRLRVEGDNREIQSGIRKCLARSAKPCRNCGTWTCANESCWSTVMSQGQMLTADMDRGDKAACEYYKKERTCLDAFKVSEYVDDNGETMLVKFLDYATPTRKAQQRSPVGLRHRHQRRKSGRVASENIRQLYKKGVL